jgi:multiple sugar transport system permease protein
MKRRGIARYVTLAVLAVLFLFPLYWAVATAFKSPGEVLSVPLTWFPRHPSFDNFIKVLEDPNANVLRWAVNSVIISLSQAGIHIVLSVLAGYAFARLTFRGRDFWFWCVLASYMLPAIVLLVPRYSQMLGLGWIDTYGSNIWIYVSGAFGVFLMRQAFLGVPDSIEEAARMDGASIFTTIFRILLPTVRTQVVTLFIMAYLFSWNDYLWPLFTLHGDMLTLPTGLARFSSRVATDYGVLMASAVVAALPAVIGFILLQRYIVEGIATSGEKE